MPQACDRIAAERRLYDVYRDYFDVVLAEGEEERNAAFRLRYAVYCVEHPFEDPAANPNGMEIDAYDAAALHALLLRRTDREAVGTVRLILPQAGTSGGNLPIRRICLHPLLAIDSDVLPRAKTAEISRFAVSKKYRRRAGDETLVGGLTEREDPRRSIPNTSLGLMQAIVAMAAKGRMTHVCAMMEPTLLRMLRRLGIHFIPLGPEVDYHGRRQPCYSDLDLLLARIWVERPEVWDVITDEGLVWPLNRERAAAIQADRVPS